MADYSLTEYTDDTKKEEKTNLTNKDAYSMPDNPSDSGYSATQIRRKLYEGELYLLQLLQEFRDLAYLSDSELRSLLSDEVTNLASLESKVNGQSFCYILSSASNSAFASSNTFTLTSGSLYLSNGTTLPLSDLRTGDIILVQESTYPHRKVDVTKVSDTSTLYTFYNVERDKVALDEIINNYYNKTSIDEKLDDKADKSALDEKVDTSTFEETDERVTTNTADIDTLKTLINTLNNVVEGNATNYVVNTEDNTYLDSNEESVTVAITENLIDVSGNTISLENLKIGDLITLLDNDENTHDRIVSAKNSSNVTLFAIVRHPDLSGYALRKNVTSVTKSGVSQETWDADGKVDVSAFNTYKAEMETTIDTINADIDEKADITSLPKLIRG